MNGIRSSLGDRQIIEYSKFQTEDILRRVRQEHVLKAAGTGFKKARLIALAILIVKILVASALLLGMS
jgi:hypothetical protein